MVPCVFLVWPRYLGNANWYLRDCTQIVNQTIDLFECFSKGLRMTCCISLCSLGVYFTDSDTGIYSKGVRDMRAFCISWEVVYDFQLRQYSSSHSRISKTFEEFTIIVMPKIRISIDYVMRTFFLLGYPSNMCAVRATWPLVDESLLLGVPYYPISITHTLDSAYILTRYELINTFSLLTMETIK